MSQGKMNIFSKQWNKLFVRSYREFHLNCIATSKTKPENDYIGAKHKINDTTRSLQKILNLNYRTALDIVNDYSELRERDATFLSTNYKHLIDNDVCSNTILKYPFLLSIPSLSNTTDRLLTLPHPLNTTIVLARLANLKLDKLIRYQKDEDKIESISRLLKVSPETGCEFISKKDFLIGRDSKVLADTIQLINDCGISMEELHKDLWVLKYSYEVVKKRIMFMKELNIESPRPWMIRSPEEVVENYAKRRLDNREILGNNSLTEYLSKTLACTDDQSKFLIHKMPALKTKSLRKLSEIINFLYCKGFRPYHIYRVPKILVHSVDTTKTRLEQLEKAGFPPDSLYMLTKSQKQFSQYFDVLTKAKK